MGTPEKKKRFPIGKLLMGIGMLLILGAAGLLGYNQWLDYNAGQKSEAAVIELVEEIEANEVEIVEMPAEPSEPSAEMIKVAELNGAYYMGVVTIPSLEKILPVQSDWSMEKLEVSPCRYSGSLAEENLVIAGHNYRKHFTGLARMVPGESVVFTDLDGQQTFYEVKEVYTAKATDIEGMVNSKYDLTLFTCNYTGKARVTVRCSEVE